MCRIVAAVMKHPKELREKFNPLLDEIEAAAFLRITPRTLRLYRRTRGVPFLKLSSKIIRFRENDLNGWADRHRVQINVR